MAADDPRSTALADGRYSDFVPVMDVAAFRARVELGFGSLFDRYPTGRVVVASHGGAINCFLANILGLSEIFFFLPAYGSVSRVERLASGRTVIRSVNETGHLEDRV
jgi:probable phosphoglycerate mutase